MGVGEPVKVVIINTQYVETDAMSFKSVVQQLTGKDSKVATSATMKQRCATSRAPVLEPAMSFKDFDRMFKDLPPLDELYRLYGE